MEWMDTELQYLKARNRELALAKERAEAEALYWKEMYLAKKASSGGGFPVAGTPAADGTRRLQALVDSLGHYLLRLRDEHIRRLLEEDEELVSLEQLQKEVERLSTENAELRRQLEQREKEESGERAQITRLEYLLQQGAKDYERIQQQLKDAREEVSKKEARIISLRKEERDLKQTIQQLEHELEELKLRSSERLVQLRNELEKKEVSLDNISDEVERLRDELLRMSEEKERYEEENEQLRFQVATLQEQVRELVESNATLSEMMELLEENVVALEDRIVDEEAPAWIVDEVDKLISYIATYLHGQREARREGSSFVVLEGDDQLRTALKNLEERLREQDRRMARMAAELEEKDVLINEYRQRLEQEGADLEEVGRLRAELEKYRRMASNTMEDASQLLERLRVKERDLHTLQEELAAAQRRIEELELIIEERDGETRRLEAQLEEMRARVALAESAGTMLQRLERVEEELMELEDAVVLEVERLGRIPLELDTIAQGIEELVPVNPLRLHELEKELAARRRQVEELNIRVGKYEGELLVLRTRLGRLKAIGDRLTDVAKNLELLGIMKAAMDIRESVELLKGLME